MCLCFSANDSEFINILSYPRSNQTSKSVQNLRKSKLETYEAILSALAKRPLTVDSIAYRTNMDCTILEQFLNSLMKNGLIQETFARRKKVYAITERGMSVFRALSFQRYLDKIAKSIKTMGTTVETAPTIESDESKKNNE